MGDLRYNFEFKGSLQTITIISQYLISFSCFVFPFPANLLNVLVSVLLSLSFESRLSRSRGRSLFSPL